MISIDALEKAAKRATPGPYIEDDGWIHSKSLPKEFDYVAWTGPYTGMEEDSGVPSRNSEYLALCSPETLLALIAVVKAAKEMKNVIDAHLRRDPARMGPNAGLLTDLRESHVAAITALLPFTPEPK